MRPKQLVLAFAATSLALCALGGVGVSSAMAETPNNSCKGANIAGQGSSLQLIAQEKVWIPGFGEHACQGGVPVVTYTGSGSAAGLAAFGVGKVETPASSKDAFIASDDAPNASQLTEMNEAANGTAGEKQDLVIPVVQAAIAIIVHPPAECLISTLRNHDLQEIWSGKTLEWSEIDNVTEMTPGACKHPITRIVRFDGSGTTYQFKHYLFEINPNLLTGTIKGTHTFERNWEELQPETEENLEWPEGATLSPVERPVAKGGGEEVKKVKATEGSIGYANLGDAREQYEAGALEWVEVQTNGSETLTEEGGENATYAPPGTASPEPGSTSASANCAETVYTGTPTKPEEPEQDWSETYGEHPDVVAVGKGHYSICTLTWDVALVNYELAGFGATASEIGQSAYDYLNYVVSNGASGGGQAEISNKHDYLALTSTVQKDAEGLTKKIAGGPRTAEAWEVNSKFILPGEEIPATTVSGKVVLSVGGVKLITCEKIEDEDDLLNWGLDLMLEFTFVNCESVSSGCPSTITALPLGGVDWPTVLASSNLLISDMTFDYNEFNLNTHGICALTEEEEISGNLEGSWVSPSGEEATFPGTGSGTTLKTGTSKEAATLSFTDLYKATAGSIMTVGE